MKTSKRFIAVLLCVLCLSACGKDSASEIPENTESSEKITEEISETETNSESETGNFEIPDIINVENELFTGELYTNQSIYKETAITTFTDGTEQKTSINIFDEYDNIIWFKSYDDNGVIVASSAIYEYNSDGLVETEYKFDENNELKRITYTEYNSDDKIKVRKIKEKKNSEMFFKYTYDEYGNELYSENESGSITDRYEYEYDESGNVVVRNQIDPKTNEIKSSEHYQYDKNGNIIETKKYNSNADTTIMPYCLIDKTEYNENNNRIRNDLIYEEEDGTITKTITSLFEYDSDGRYVKTEQYINDQITSYTEYEYKFY